MTSSILWNGITSVFVTYKFITCQSNSLHGYYLAMQSTWMQPSESTHKRNRIPIRFGMHQDECRLCIGIIKIFHWLNQEALEHATGHHRLQKIYIYTDKLWQVKYLCVVIFFPLISVDFFLYVENWVWLTVIETIKPFAFSEVVHQTNVFDKHARTEWIFEFMKRILSHKLGNRITYY